MGKKQEYHESIIEKIEDGQVYLKGNIGPYKISPYISDKYILPGAHVRYRNGEIVHILHVPIPDNSISSETKYKIGYYDSHGKRTYKIVSTKEDALDLISARLDSPGQISVKQIPSISLDNEK